MNIRLIGFKNYKQETVFDAPEVGIYFKQGQNGTGKTAMLEAIVFCLYGKDFYGNTGADKLINNDSDEAIVEVLLPSGNTVKRIMTRQSTTIFLNDVETTQKSIDELVGGKDALFVYNPMAFGALDVKEKRELFMRLLPRIPLQDVFEQDFPDSIAMLGEYKNSSAKSVKESLDRLMMAKTGYENTRLAAKTTMSINRTNIAEKKKQLLTFIDNTKEAIDDFNSYKVLSSKLEADAVKEYEELLRQDKIIEGRLVSKAKEMIESVGNSQVSNITAALSYYDLVLQSLGTSIKEASDIVSFAEQSIKNLSLAGGKNVCPVCGNMINPDHVRQEIATQSAQRDVNAQKLASLNENRKDIERLRDSFISIRDDIIKARKTIEERTTKLSELQQLEAAIQSKQLELKDKYGKLDVDMVIEQSAIKASIETLEAQNKELEKKIVEAEESESKIVPQIERLQELQKLYSNKGVSSAIVKRQAVQLNTDIAEYISDVEVVTIRENKTNDNVKEVFDITLDGVLYDTLSFSEKIKINIAFSQVIKKYLGNVENFVLLDEVSVFDQSGLQYLTSVFTKDIYVFATKVSEESSYGLSGKNTKTERKSRKR